MATQLGYAAEAFKKKDSMGRGNTLIACLLALLYAALFFSCMRPLCLFYGEPRHECCQPHQR